MKLRVTVYKWKSIYGPVHSWYFNEAGKPDTAVLASPKDYDTREAALADLRTVCAALGCEVPEVEEP